MFICLNCKHVFDDEEVSVWQEDRGEYWGTSCYEMVSGCPHCNGDYANTYRCSCCDEWIDGKYIKLESGERICENCYVMHEIRDED